MASQSPLEVSHTEEWWKHMKWGGSVLHASCYLLSCGIGNCLKRAGNHYLWSRIFEKRKHFQIGQTYPCLYCVERCIEGWCTTSGPELPPGGRRNVGTCDSQRGGRAKFLQMNTSQGLSIYVSVWVSLIHSQHQWRSLAAGRKGSRKEENKWKEGSGKSTQSFNEVHILTRRDLLEIVQIPSTCIS